MGKLNELLSIMISKLNASVKTEAQDLTEEQKAQARENIGISESGGGGATTWADLAVTGYWEGPLLFNTDAIFMEDDCMFVLMDSIGLSAGAEYTVAMETDIVTSITEYKCLCETVNIDGVDALALGNTSVIGGTIASEAPFALITGLPAESGFGTVIMPLDGATEMHIQNISGPVEVITPCPARYLSTAPYVVNFDVSEDGKVITNAFFNDVLAVIKRAERTVIAYMKASDGPTIVFNLDRFDDEHISFSSATISGDRIQLINIFWQNWATPSATTVYK